MSRTNVKNFYEKSMDDLTRAINSYMKSNNHEIVSMHVFQSPKNAWFEAIVIFQAPIVISVEQANQLKAAFESDSVETGIRPTIITGPGITTSPPKKP